MVSGYLADARFNNVGSIEAVMHPSAVIMLIPQLPNKAGSRGNDADSFTLNG